MGGKGSLARRGKAISPTATGSGGVVLTLDGFDRLIEASGLVVRGRVGNHVPRALAPG